MTRTFRIVTLNFRFRVGAMSRLLNGILILHCTSAVSQLITGTWATGESYLDCLTVVGCGCVGTLRQAVSVGRRSLSGLRSKRCV